MLRLVRLLGLTSARQFAAPTAPPTPPTALTAPAAMEPLTAPRPAPLAVRPAANPGAAATAASLRELWAGQDARDDVLGFYGHRQGEHRCFSNFFDQSAEPFDFEVPEEFLAPGLGPVPRVVSCRFSEQAIMLCKAAAMGDAESFGSVAAASSPAKMKAIGRRVRGFEGPLWDRIVCSVAFEVVYQKFLRSPSLTPLLLGTGERLIAEATRNDRIWGIGIDKDDQRVGVPSEWQGSNILGWALMEARTALRAGAAEAPGAEAAAATDRKRRRDGD